LIVFALAEIVYYVNKELADISYLFEILVERETLKNKISMCLGKKTERCNNIQARGLISTHYFSQIT